MNIVIIGGGAAGFFSAIHNKNAYPKATVTILEKSAHVLSKVKISGGGRCNVTHACFDPRDLIQFYPRGGKELLGPFHQFNPRQTVDWFMQHGVRLKTEQDNRMFPVTNSSQTIIDCLVQKANTLKIRVKTHTHVTQIKRTPTGFELTLSEGNVIQCSKLILATGSSRQGHDFARQLGHTIHRPVPSLFTFNIKDSRLHQRKGLSVAHTHAWLKGQQKKFQQGPTLITHWGLSGPSIIKLSAWHARELHDTQYKGVLCINWLPDYPPNQLHQHLTSLQKKSPKKQCVTQSPFSEIPLRLWTYILMKSDIPEQQTWGSLQQKAIHRLIKQLQCMEFEINGKGQFKEEFVTCGGVTLNEINFKTMESKRCPGLHLIGELLDIDGVTGGFNFQNAWTTGYLSSC